MSPINLRNSPYSRYSQNVFIGNIKTSGDIDEESLIRVVEENLYHNSSMIGRSMYRGSPIESVIVIINHNQSLSEIKSSVTKNSTNKEVEQPINTKLLLI